MLVETVQTIGSKFYKTYRRNKANRFSTNTLNLMTERQEMRLQSTTDASAYRRINRQISRSQNCDLPHFNTERLKNAIEQNRGSKVFARDLSIGQSKLM
ncbi:jg9733 [Pararge aegeria aegeria]|uniref:Jg9733 protein n=1 Tax=Pararge aegeria aegeria TaxID=348720 RepID=A0A8S4QUC4_9NEOP|nr:jg9733 [Pararge aegeria aegeria]